MDEEIEVLKGYVESLGLDQKSSLTQKDLNDLIQALHDGDELGLYNYVRKLKGPNELSDFIVNVVYG